MGIHNVSLSKDSGKLEAKPHQNFVFVTFELDDVLPVVAKERHNFSANHLLFLDTSS